MATFLLLTRKEFGSVSVNVDHIAFISPRSETGGTIIRFATGNLGIDVIEPYQDVMTKIKELEQ